MFWSSLKTIIVDIITAYTGFKTQGEYNWDCNSDANPME